MTMYVTREEYDALNRRILALERRAQETPTLQMIKVMIAEGVSAALTGHERLSRRGGIVGQRYAAQKG